tara:strand:- start:618 stop:815 length:198 start_codon:yes stop_codon:yes gene_type:complete
MNKYTDKDYEKILSNWVSREISDEEDLEIKTLHINYVSDCDRLKQKYFDDIENIKKKYEGKVAET